MALETKLKKPSAKGAPPASPSEVLSSTTPVGKASSAKLVPLNFSVAPDFKKELKLLSANYDKPMTVILKEAVELWKQANGVS